jgi:hypothetical protein
MDYVNRTQFIVTIFMIKNILEKFDFHINFSLK